MGRAKHDPSMRPSSRDTRAPSERALASEQASGRTKEYIPPSPGGRLVYIMSEEINERK